MADPRSISGDAHTHFSSAAEFRPSKESGCAGRSAWMALADRLLRTGLSGGSPQGHVLYMILERTRRLGAACTGLPRARNETVQRGVVPQMREQGDGVA